MNRLAKTIIVTIIMILFSATGKIVTQAKAIGVGAELQGDIFTGLYLGASVGVNTLDSDTLSTTVSVFDDSASSLGIIGGYRFTKFFSVEMLANYFGHQNYYIGTTGITAEVFNVGLGGNVYLPLGEIISDPNLNFVSLFIKGGIHYWDAEAVTTTFPGVLYLYTDEGISPFYGCGLNVDIFNHLTLRGEYTIFNLDSGDSIDNATIKIIFTF